MSGVPPSLSTNQKISALIWGAIGVFAGAALMCIVYFISIPPHGRAIVLLPQPTSLPVYIHMDGQVVNPGVYALSPSSRVDDAIEQAGGITDLADTTDINLAMKIYDGQKIYIPTKGEEHINPITDTKDTGIEVLTVKININTATQSELEKLPGIGPTKAGNIITYREENGSFMVIEDLLKVTGIGNATYEEIKDLIVTE